MKHIGIVACSAEGASLCYRTICAEGAARLGGHRHPEITMHTPPLSAYIACLERGDREDIAALMLRSAEVLAGAGADFLICPDNTIHQAFDLVAPRSPRPWLHIADEVASEATRQGLGRLGLLGTRWLVESAVYPEALDRARIGWMRPDPAEFGKIDRIIFEELVMGRFCDEAARYHLEVIARLARAGCDGVVLGCTEIPLLLQGRPAHVPMLDSTRILARAALDRALTE